MGDQVSTRPSLKNQVLFDFIFNHFNNVNTFSRFRKNYTLKDSRLRGKRNLPLFMNNLDFSKHISLLLSNHLSRLTIVKMKLFSD